MWGGSGIRSWLGLNGRSLGAGMLGDSVATADWGVSLVGGWKGLKWRRVFMMRLSAPLPLPPADVLDLPRKVLLSLLLPVPWSPDVIVLTLWWRGRRRCVFRARSRISATSRTKVLVIPILRLVIDRVRIRVDDNRV